MFPVIRYTYFISKWRLYWCDQLKMVPSGNPYICHSPIKWFFIQKRNWWINVICRMTHCEESTISFNIRLLDIRLKWFFPWYDKLMKCNEIICKITVLCCPLQQTCTEPNDILTVCFFFQSKASDPCPQCDWEEDDVPSGFRSSYRHWCSHHHCTTVERGRVCHHRITMETRQIWRRPFFYCWEHSEFEVRNENFASLKSRSSWNKWHGNYEWAYSIHMILACIKEFLFDSDEQLIMHG